MESEDYYKSEKVFAGKNIIITGATGEIGFDIASKLITYGTNKVIAIGKNEKKLKDKFSKKKLFKCLFFPYNNINNNIVIENKNININITLINSLIVS